MAGSTGTPGGPPCASTQVITPPPLAIITPSPQPALSAPAQFAVENKECSANAYVVRLSWQDASGEGGYNIYRDGGLIDTLSADATVYDDTPSDYSPHSYYVEAFNSSESASSSVKQSEGCLY